MTNETGRSGDMHLFPSIKTYYSQPLVLVEGSGSRVKDESGNEYLDLFGGILTVSVGHCHPRVTEAVADQVRRLVHTSTCYLNRPMLDLAARLADITPGGLQRCFFTNSGTEAIETAVNAARVHTGNHHIIALRHSYHGRSSLATSLTGNAAWRSPGTDLPGIVHSLSGYCYRCPLHLTYPGCDMACAWDMENLIQTTTCGEVAALVAEPIQGVGGFITPPPEFFGIVVDIVKRHGGVFICDEVQTGFGRTGDHMFGIEHWGVEPDMMVFAKGLANGAPIGATIATSRVADSLTTASISTFGGNPVSMVAALATLDVIEDEDVAGHATTMGGIMREGLDRLMDRFPFIGEVRGKGLMLGLELVENDRAPAPDLTSAFLETARGMGLLVGRGGLFGNVVRLTPPMTIGRSDVEDALDRLEATCRQLKAG